MHDTSIVHNALQGLGVLPVTVVLTAYLKQFVPNKHRVLIPLLLGPLLSVLSHYVYGEPLAGNVWAVLWEGGGIGALTGVGVKYATDNGVDPSAGVRSAISAVVAKINGGEK